MSSRRTIGLPMVGVAFALLLGFAIAGFAQVATRSITIKSEPSATVWLNGVRYGVTDSSGTFEIQNAPAGRHSIRVRANGFREVTKPILPAQKGTIEIALVKTTDEGELAFQEAESLSGTDRAKAAEAYRKAIKLKPANVDAHIGLARTLNDAGDIEGSSRAIKQAAKLSPRNGEAAAVEGRIMVAAGDEAKAIAAFKRAIANGGGIQPEAHTGIAMLYQDRAETAGGESNVDVEQKNYAEAAKSFAVAVKQLGTSPDAQVVMQLLGLVYEKQNKFKEAIALYETFLRLFPDSADATAVQSFIVQLKKQLTEQ